MGVETSSCRRNGNQSDDEGEVGDRLRVMKRCEEGEAARALKEND